MNRWFQIVGFVALLSTVVTANAAPHSPASYFFPTDDIIAVRVSPGGEFVVAVATYKGKYGLIAQQVGSGRARPVATLPGSVDNLYWIDSDTLYFEMDQKDEGTHFVRIDFTAGADGIFQHETTPFFRFGTIVAPLPGIANTVAWSFSRNSTTRLYRVDLDKFAKSKVRSGWATPPPGEEMAAIKSWDVRWIVDQEGHARAAVRLMDRHYTILFRDDTEGDFETVASYEYGADDRVWPIALTQDSRRLIVKGFNGHEKRGLFEFDPRTKEFGLKLFQRDDADVGVVDFDPVTGDVLSVKYSEGSEDRRHFFPEATARYADRIGPEDPDLDEIKLVSSSKDRQQFVYWTSGVTEPGVHAFRNSATGTTSIIGLTGSEIDRNALSGMESFMVESSDGLAIEALLTLPKVEAGHPAPLLVMPHGGPIGVHDRQRFNPVVQYFASWGFAVLQVNYRGSSGYGDAFEKAGQKEWAQGIEDDIDAAMEAAIARPEISGENICVIGGSYGGFSAVASALRNPDQIDCAVTFNGVSDILLLGETSDFADYKTTLESFQEDVGDFVDERDKLLEISPAYHLRDLKVPVLVVYGDRDRRVDPDHSHRLLIMLELYEKAFEEIRIEKARHSLTDEEWIALLPKLRAFLSKYLMPGQPLVPDPTPAEPDSDSIDVDANEIVPVEGENKHAPEA